MAGLLIAVAGLAGATASASAGEPIVTSDLLRIRQVTSIDVASDGSRAVYAVRSVAKEPPNGRVARDDGERIDRYEYRSHLFAVSLRDATANPRQLTFGRRRDGDPVLSPGGNQVAFVRLAEELDEEGERRGQVWLLDLRGGEARQLTSLEHGAFAPRWSPDGSRLLVQSRLPISAIDGVPPWPAERPQRGWDDVDVAAAPRPDGTREEIRAWLARNARAHDPLVITRIAFQGERRLRREMSFTHLYLIDVDDPEAEPRRITDGFYDHAEAAFLGDGSRIVYSTSRPAVEHPDRVQQRSLWTVGPEGGDDRELLSMEGWRLRSPRPSPDGAMLAFSGQQLDEPTFRQSRLGVVALGGDAAPEPSWLTEPASFDSSVRSFEWVAGRSSLIFNASRQGGVPLLTASFGLLEPVPLVVATDEYLVGVQTFDTGGGAIVYAVNSPANPCMLWARDSRGDWPLHDLNAWVADKDLSMPRDGWISRPDGVRVQYWIMEPTNREPGRRYPLALQIHGGPSSMWGPGESTMWHEFQLLCSWGYGVVYANPRGSSGYGYAFQKGNYQDWGDGPAGDVLAAVDEALTEDWVDRNRLVVTGGSYAGYLTAWIVAHDHRFKAAVAQRGVYDLQTFFGEGNAWRLVRWAMGGHPWEARTGPILRRESPFTYVDRIRTPLMILHASEDLRTGVSQSEMLYRALKELGHDVEYIRYPGAGHDLSRSGDPGQRMDRLNRIIEFFERHIDNPRPAPLPGPSRESAAAPEDEGADLP